MSNPIRHSIFDPRESAMPDFTFGWTDIEDIAEALREKHPDRDPLSVRFPELAGMVESLDGFQPPPGQSVNEQILEAIQAAWHQEKVEDEQDD